MDLNKLDQNQIEGAAVLILLVGVGVVAALVILPMMKRADGLRSETRLVTQEISRVRDFMKANDSGLTGNRLISSHEAALALEEITVLGNKHEIAFLSMVRQDKAKVSSKKLKTANASRLFNTLPVELETRSTYKELGLFLGGLNDLRESIILIDDLQIAQDKRDPGSVRSKIRINICLKNEDHGKK